MGEPAGRRARYAWGRGPKGPSQGAPKGRPGALTSEVSKELKKLDKELNIFN